MFRTSLLSIILLVLALFQQSCKGQPTKEDSKTTVDNGYLFRKHIDKDSTWIEPNTNCYYVENAGMNMDHGGWHWAKDLKKQESNFFYWEAETLGMVKIEFDLPKGVTAINFDTISKLNYDFINYFCGDARTDSTEDKLSGILTFTTNTNKRIIIDGKINIDTKKPVTHQEIVFKKYNLPISSLSDVISNEKSRAEEWKKQVVAEMETDNNVSIVRKRFYDSVFNLNRFSRNKLKANISSNPIFDFHLSKSYVLTNANLSEAIKEDMEELLDGNPVIVEQGSKAVFVFHSVQDPVKNSIDDETNYSLNIQVDNIVESKTYSSDKTQNEIVTKLVYWHYGPNGTLISSKESSGTLTITENNSEKVSGEIDIKILNNDKTDFHIKGHFELPKIKASDILDFEKNLSSRLLSK